MYLTLDGVPSKSWRDIRRTLLGYVLEKVGNKAQTPLYRFVWDCQISHNIGENSNS